MIIDNTGSRAYGSHSVGPVLMQTVLRHISGETQIERSCARSVVCSKIERCQGCSH
jgi:hypothetical protein